MLTEFTNKECRIEMTRACRVMVGIGAHLYQKILDFELGAGDRCALGTEVDRFDKLKLQDFEGCFFLFLIGQAIASAALIVEKSYRTSRKPRRKHSDSSHRQRRRVFRNTGQARNSLRPMDAYLTLWAGAVRYYRPWHEREAIVHLARGVTKS